MQFFRLMIPFSLCLLLAAAMFVSGPPSVPLTSASTMMPTAGPGSSCTTPPAAQASPSVVQRGSSVSFSAYGFAPGSTATVSISGPTPGLSNAPSTVIGPTCGFVLPVQVSLTDPPGTYTITASGHRYGTMAPFAPFALYSVVGAVAPPPPVVIVQPPPASVIAPPPPPAVVVPPPPPPAVVAPPPAPAAPSIPQSPPAVAGQAPVAVQQTLSLVGGAQVPAVGQTSTYEHVVRIAGPSSTGSVTFTASSVGLSPRGAASRNILSQGASLVVHFETTYGDDTRIVRTTSNVGSATVRGASVLWDGQLGAGESLELRTTVDQTPTTALALNQPIKGQSLNVADSRGASLVVPPLAPPALPPAQRLVQPAPPPVDPITGSRYFADTGFAVADDGIWNFYVRRGGQRTFGAPISRLMVLNGGTVQLFERAMLQALDDGRVVSVNLLEAPFLPYELYGDVSLPLSEAALLEAAPDPGLGDFADRSQEFVRANSAEDFDGWPTRFYAGFLSTVLFRDAFFDGQGDPGLLPGFGLEIWGLPTSRAGYQALAGDAVDPSVVLQRFQRGVMRYSVTSARTEPVSLGIYVKAVLMGDTTFQALTEVATSSPLWAQYNSDSPYWVDRPDELPDTDLILAFEPL
ncbi:MAG: MurNAc-LAA protein [Chloroflexi bacterium]|nr:MurNAc-LAA protein [Chloroflexota bacterium]